MISSISPTSRCFNPRPPCGGRRHRRGRQQHNRHVSIHAPRAGGDGTRPALRNPPGVSIHAPRAGGDARRRSGRHREGPCFNPRPPCGGRRGDEPTDEAVPRRFQSTPPVRGATLRIRLATDPLLFQSTPPVRGATRGLGDWRVNARYAFQSTPPVRGATRCRARLRGPHCEDAFQSTPPVRGATPGAYSPMVLGDFCPFARTRSGWLDSAPGLRVEASYFVVRERLGCRANPSDEYGQLRVRTGHITNGASGS